MFSQQNYPGTLVIALLLALAIAVPTAPPNTAADKIKISYTSADPRHGLLRRGDAAGLFKRNHFDLEISYIPGKISAPSLMSPVRFQGGEPVRKPQSNRRRTSNRPPAR